MIIVLSGALTYLVYVVSVSGYDIKAVRFLLNVMLIGKFGSKLKFHAHFHQNEMRTNTKQIHNGASYARPKWHLSVEFRCCIMSHNCQ